MGEGGLARSGKEEVAEKSCQMAGLGGSGTGTPPPKSLSSWGGVGGGGMKSILAGVVWGGGLGERRREGER